MVSICISYFSFSIHFVSAFADMIPVEHGITPRLRLIILPLWRQLRITLNNLQMECMVQC